MSASGAAKWAVIGSICIFSAVTLQGVNEALWKANNLTIIQITIMKFGVQIIIAILCGI